MFLFQTVDLTSNSKYQCHVLNRCVAVAGKLKNCLDRPCPDRQAKCPDRPEKRPDRTVKWAPKRTVRTSPGLVNV